MTEAHTIGATGRPATPPRGIVPVMSPDVEAFCRRHECLDELWKITRIAGDCFDAARARLSLQSDPETHEEWIEVAVDAIGNVQQLMEAEHHFTQRLHDEVSLYTRDHVRLYLTSADD